MNNLLPETREEKIRIAGYLFVAAILSVLTILAGREVMSEHAR